MEVIKTESGLKFDRQLVTILSAVLRVKEPTEKLIAKELNCSKKTVERVISLYPGWFWRRGGAEARVCLMTYAQEALKGGRVVLPD